MRINFRPSTLIQPNCWNPREFYGQSRQRSEILLCLWCAIYLLDTTTAASRKIYNWLSGPGELHGGREGKSFALVSIMAHICISGHNHRRRRQRRRMAGSFPKRGGISLLEMGFPHEHGEDVAKSYLRFSFLQHVASARCSGRNCCWLCCVLRARANWGRSYIIMPSRRLVDSGRPT